MLLVGPFPSAPTFLVMRVAHRPPKACASCGGQYPDREHVDFESHWDGPLLDPERPRMGRIQELVLCEECVRTAHDHLSEQSSTIADARAAEAAAELEARKAREYAKDLEATLQRRPDSMVAGEPLVDEGDGGDREPMPFLPPAMVEA